METKIMNFRKTNHFLYSQWDRSIDDNMLHKILPFIECTDCKKDVIIVLPSFLQRKGLAKDDKKCLILIVREANVLITAYWCDHPNYIFKKEKDAHFQMLY